MGQWEKEILDKADIKPTVYYRYVDDIFGIFEGTEEELKSI